MTKKEALEYLGGDEEFLLDEYEQKLFDFKQYFLTKPIVSRLYDTQFKKMSVLHDAGSILGLQKTVGPIDFSFSDFSSCIIDAFSQFEREKAVIKSKLINSESVSELISWAKALLNSQNNYISLWPVKEDMEFDGVLIGKEPDPMDLLRDIKELANEGINHFDELTISSCETLVTFHSEWKRLSLLRQKEHEWKKASSIN